MASTKQSQVIVGHLVEFQQEFETARADVGQFFIQKTAQAIALSIRAVEKYLDDLESQSGPGVVSPVNAVSASMPPKKRLLSEPVCTFSVPPTTEKFVAKDKFKVDTSRKAKVKISLLGDNFKSWFLGKTEDPHPGSTISGRTLKKNSVDFPILAELGGDEAAETTLIEMYAAMAAQPNGENGDLQIGRVNIYYIRDVNGTLRAVRVYWGGVGWGVGARSVENPHEWSANSRVFSRNSLAA